jgi:alpha-galactosidase
MTLALRPPMGWNSWNYGLNERNRADFSRLTEKTMLAQAQAMVDSGMLAAGYEYFVLDDGYQNARRDYQGRLQGHALRFRNGIPQLVNDVKALGLKFGIYSVPGSLTCAQQYDDYIADGLGSINKERIDAQAFAEWGIDYLKYDWCRAHLNDGLVPKEAFKKMADELKLTGRDIVYSISEYGFWEPHLWAPEFTNLWRTTDDLFADWDSLLRTLDLQKNLYPYSRPGAWNDPDMLQVGNGSLTTAENRAHFFLWAVLNAPLMAGNDLTRMSDEVRDLLIHPGIIEIDQDWSGEQGKLAWSEGDLQVWSKQMSEAAGGGVAAVLLNRGDTTGHFNLETAVGNYSTAKDVWSGDSIASVGNHEVEPHGALLLRLNK